MTPPVCPVPRALSRRSHDSRQTRDLQFPTERRLVLAGERTAATPGVREREAPRALERESIRGRSAGHGPVAVGAVRRAPPEREDPVGVRRQRLDLGPTRLHLALDEHLMGSPVLRPPPHLDVAVPAVGHERELVRAHRGGLFHVMLHEATVRTAASGVVARRRAPAEVETRLILRIREGTIAKLMPDEEAHARAPCLVERLGNPACVELHRDGVRIGPVGVPAELRDPERNRALRRQRVARCLGGSERLPHLRQVAEGDAVRAPLLPERAAVRVRMVRPCIEMNGASGHLRERVGEAEELAHEPQRRDPVAARQAAGDDRRPGVDLVDARVERVQQVAVHAR